MSKTHFLIKDIQMANKCIKGYLPQITKEMQSKITMRQDCISMKYSENIGKLEPSDAACWNVKCTGTLESSLAVPQKVKHITPI